MSSQLIQVLDCLSAMIHICTQPRNETHINVRRIQSKARHSGTNQIQTIARQYCLQYGMQCHMFAMHVSKAVNYLCYECIYLDLSAQVYPKWNFLIKQLFWLSPLIKLGPYLLRQCIPIRSIAQIRWNFNIFQTISVLICSARLEVVCFSCYRCTRWCPWSVNI